MSAYTAGFDGPLEDRQQGLLGRFREFFAPAEPGFVREEPEREFSCIYRPEEPLRLLADGDAFEFLVFPTYEWKGMARDRDELRDWTGPLHGRAARQAAHVLQPIARTFEPHKCRDFEIAANKRTYDQWWTVRSEGQAYSLGFTVRVEPDERVREQMRPYWEARIKAECDHKLGMQRARQVDELTRHWSAILEKLEREPSMIHAAMLSETTFAAVFDAFVKGKHQKVNELLDLLKKAADAHRNDVGLGPSDYTRAWDQALKAFQRLHGLDEKGTPKADEA